MSDNKAVQKSREIPVAVMPARRFVLGTLSPLEKGLILVSCNKSHREFVYEINGNDITTIRRLPDTEEGRKSIEQNNYERKVFVEEGRRKMFELNLRTSHPVVKNPDYGSGLYDLYDQALKEAGE